MNNTPIVAMLMPRVQRWCKDRGFSASQVLIPLSYAAIAGGMVTLIGTSTNVVVSEVSIDLGGPALGLLDFTWVGLPVVLFLLLFFVIGGWRLLPRHDADMIDDGLGDCLFELAVDGPSIAGRSVEAADLRDLGRAFLAHIRRNETVIPASPSTLLKDGDVLSFVGPMELLNVLLRRDGLSRPIAMPTTVADLPLFEAVVAENSVLAGSTLRSTKFRDRYGGVVLAVHRRDVVVSESLGRLRLMAGDLLIVEADSGFSRRANADRSDFHLVARRDQPAPAADTNWVGPALLIAMVVCVATGALPLVTASFLTAIGAIAMGGVSLRRARESVDLSVLLIIGSALGIGRAIVDTGLSENLTSLLLALGGSLDAVWGLALLYVSANVLTELITHKASAVLMVPVALDLADRLGIAEEAALLTVAAAAAASFLTPVGYQTNTMVLSAGNYRFADFLRVGFPTSLLVMAVALTMIKLRFLG